MAFDIDGTFGMYHEHILHFFDLYFGYTLPRDWDGEGNWEDHLHLTRKQYQDAKLAFRQGGWKRWMPVFPGAKDLTLTARELGAEIWITTTRPYLRLDSVDPDTSHWLFREGIRYDYLLYHDLKYRELKQQVDPQRVAFVLEDLPLQYIEAHDAFDGAAFMIGRDHNRVFRHHRPQVAVLEDLEQANKVMTERLELWRDLHAS